MRIGIARLYARSGQLEYNFKKIEELYGKALESKLEMVIFPRLSTSGFPINNNFNDDGYTEKLMEYLEKIISLTDGKETRMLLGSPLKETIGGEDGKIIGTELRDAALFINDGRVDTEIFRKEIDRANATEDYRYFDRHRFLKYFSHGNKKFMVLLSDDIYSNFNLFLVKDSEPNYVICLDSNTLRSPETRQKHLIKLAKFANSPVFYLNSASYHGGMLFRGEVILINEDFRVIFEDLYEDDKILPLEIDCEDGTEIFLRTPHRNTSPLYIMEKYFNSDKITIDVNKLLDSELEHMKKTNCRMVTFDKTIKYTAEFLDIADYINPKLFDRLTNGEQQIIRDKIVDLHHDRYSG
jgi:predicted amidohydrolase